MRTNRLYGLLAALLLFTFAGYAQDVTVKLICNLNGLNERNIENLCRFDGQPNDVRTKDYEVEITQNQTIEWVAESTDGTAIPIVRVEYVRGTNAFQDKELPPNAQGRVRGRPVRITPRDNPMIYSITIEPDPDGGRLVLDPILRVPN